MTRHKSTKTCVICGTEFCAPPSSKKITCSKACSAIRKTQSHKDKHNVWTPDALARYKANPAHQKQAKAQASVAAKAASERPEGQKGSQNRECKVWILRAPDGTLHRAVGLLPWAREHYMLFEPDAPDPNAAVRRIAAGFSAIAGSMFYGSPTRKRNPVTSYKGWQLLSVADKTHDEQVNALADYHKNQQKNENAKEDAKNENRKSE